MNVHYILIDDLNPEHRELSICRCGTVNRVRLGDDCYRTYASLRIDAHDYAALFHYGVIEACNALPFLSESGNSLDSWDEAFLYRTHLQELATILEDAAGNMALQASETILLGWQDQPTAVAYLRSIDPAKTVDFLEKLALFVWESEQGGYDLEFIL
jgi:hypothetical protein